MRKQLRLRITRIRGNRADLLGVVTAADEKSAIKVAKEDYKITDPEKQKRLVARRSASRGRRMSLMTFGLNLRMAGQSKAPPGSCAAKVPWKMLGKRRKGLA
jgi:hypothetical protein